MRKSLRKNIHSLTVSNPRAQLEDPPSNIADFIHFRRFIDNVLCTFRIDSLRRCCIRCELRKLGEQPVAIFEESVLMNAVERVPVVRLRTLQLLDLIVRELYVGILLHGFFREEFLLISPLDVVPKIRKEMKTLVERVL